MKKLQDIHQPKPSPGKPVREVRGMAGLFGAIFSDPRKSDSDNIIQDGMSKRFDNQGRRI